MDRLNALLDDAAMHASTAIKFDSLGTRSLSIDEYRMGIKILGRVMKEYSTQAPVVVLRARCGRYAYRIKVLERAEGSQ